MLRNRVVLLAFLSVIIFASCNKVPEHAKYIPKNAMIVVGLNTKELSKKLAWDVLMGSKLLEEMKTKSPDNTQAAQGLGDAGIDVLNTTFFYFSPAASQEGYNYITAVVPLDDSKKWETYIQKNFSGATVKEVKDRKEALLEEDLYASWNKDIAIVRKAFINSKNNQEQLLDYSEGDSAFTAPDLNTIDPKPDPARLSTDMAAAFTLQKDNDITTDKRFTGLQKDGNDISFWMNYEVFMNNMNATSQGFMGGLALGNSIWKDAGYAAGINLDKGKVHAAVKYYLSKDLMDVYSKIGNKDFDKEMMDRLPSQNLNMIAGINISPEGTKALLEKMGMLGFVSLALMQSDLTADDIFQSFTGDIVMSLSDFSVQAKTDTAASLNGGGYMDNKETNMSFIFALKIKDKVRFNKLLAYAKGQNGLSAVDATTYQLAGSKDMIISIDKGFVVFANKTALAKGYVNGDYQSQSKPDIVKKEIYGHPTGVFVDIQSFLNGATSDNASEQEKELLALSKTVFKDLIINGGENKKELFTFSGTLNLVNKDENSLLQLLDYSYRISEINKKYDHREKPDDMPVAQGSDTTMTN